MNGQSNREIAKAEAIDRSTVGRILSQQEVVNLVAQNQSHLLSLVPRAIEVCEEAMESDDEASPSCRRGRTVPRNAKLAPPSP